MKRFLIPLSFALSATLGLAETKSFDFNCEAWADGEPPKEVFVVEGQFKVVSKDNNKVLEIGVGELVDANALLGDSAAGSASITARVFGSKQGRSMPKIAIGVHGQSGYRLVIFAAQKQLQLVKADEVIQSIPFTWTSDAWLRVKLEAKKVAEGNWSITAKTWADGAEEPKEAAITHEDKTLKGQGKCSIWGTTFSNTPILFDDLKIEVEQAK